MLVIEQCDDFIEQRLRLCFAITIFGEYGFVQLQQVFVQGDDLFFERDLKLALNDALVNHAQHFIIGRRQLPDGPNTKT